MRPIAMRCTQEQFDSIKDRITLPINSVTDFKRYSYLINFDEGISNIKQSYCFSNFWDQNPEIHETFDANIFLEACDIEVEKVFELTDFQFRTKGTEEWLSYIEPSETEYRIKPQPNYQKEIEDLQ